MAICKRLWQIVNIVWGPEKYRDLAEYGCLWLVEHMSELTNTTMSMAKLHSKADSVGGYRDPET